MGDHVQVLFPAQGSYALQLGSIGRYGSRVGGSVGQYHGTTVEPPNTSGWQVKLCDPLVTHGPYLSALEIKGL